MKHIKQLFMFLLVLSILLGVGIWYFTEYSHYGFAREVSLKEKQLREQVVATASKWVGTPEGSDGHRQILEIYNSHTPLAQNYQVTETDNWCSAFVSAVAIECSLTEVIPTECGCERQTGLWKDMGGWQESDNYLPLPGDFIYYAWDEAWNFDDCTGWADHVGIVAGTAGPFIRVIEGNWSDQVSVRILLRGHPEIRGYGLPDYQTAAQNSNTAD